MLLRVKMYHENKGVYLFFIIFLGFPDDKNQSDNPQKTKATLFNNDLSLNDR